MANKNNGYDLTGNLEAVYPPIPWFLDKVLLPNNQSFSRLYSSQHIPQELFIRIFGHYFESEWIVLSAVNFEYIVFLEGRKCNNLVVIEQIICTRLG